MISPIWRHLTKPAGMTAQQLADATGMSVVAVRADLVDLEAQGKLSRVRGKVGQPHLWYRSEKKPLDGLDVLLIMGLAADYHRSADRLKEVLAKIGMRAKHKGLQRIVLMCCQSRDPHEIVRVSIQEYDAESFAEAA